MQRFTAMYCEWIRNCSVFCIHVFVNTSTLDAVFHTYSVYVHTDVRILGVQFQSVRLRVQKYLFRDCLSHARMHTHKHVHMHSYT